MDDFRLNGGVLIIGSLFWDDGGLRESWRTNSLLIGQHMSIPVPIRYGSLSGERQNTYTMVFSSECKAPTLLGKGSAVPFCNNPVNVESLYRQSEALIKAERKKDPEKPLYNWEWGGIGNHSQPFFGRREPKTAAGLMEEKIWKRVKSGTVQGW